MTGRLGSDSAASVFSDPVVCYGYCILPEMLQSHAWVLKGDGVSGT